MLFVRFDQKNRIRYIVGVWLFGDVVGSLPSWFCVVVILVQTSGRGLDGQGADYACGCKSRSRELQDRGFASRSGRSGKDVASGEGAQVQMKKTSGRRGREEQCCSRGDCVRQKRRLPVAWTGRAGAEGEQASAGALETPRKGDPGGTQGRNRAAIGGRVLRNSYGTCANKFAWLHLGQLSTEKPPVCLGRRQALPIASSIQDFWKPKPCFLVFKSSAHP